MDCFVDLPYLPAGRGKRFFFGRLTIVFSVDFVDGQDVGWCKIWTTSRQAASFMSRLVLLIDLNNTKEAV